MLGVLWPGLAWDTFFCFLTSLAFGGAMSKVCSIFLLPGCGDGIVVSRLMGAPPIRRYVTDVGIGPIIVLISCGWSGSLILRFWVVGAIFPSWSCSRPRLPHLYGVLCCR